MKNIQKSIIRYIKFLFEIVMFFVRVIFILLYNCQNMTILFFNQNRVYIKAS